MRFAGDFTPENRQLLLSIQQEKNYAKMDEWKVIAKLSVSPLTGKNTLSTIVYQMNAGKTVLITVTGHSSSTMCLIWNVRCTSDS